MRILLRDNNHFIMRSVRAPKKNSASQQFDNIIKNGHILGEDI